MGILDAKALRDDIVARLLTDEVDLETSAYLDRILELAEMEEAEHQFLNDPFDRSVALVLQLFQDNQSIPNYSANLSVGNTYYWKIVTVDRSGNKSESVIQTFSISS